MHKAYRARRVRRVTRAYKAHRVLPAQQETQVPMAIQGLRDLPVQRVWGQPGLLDHKVQAVALQVQPAQQGLQELQEAAAVQPGLQDQQAPRAIMVHKALKATLGLQVQPVRRACKALPALRGHKAYKVFRGHRVTRVLPASKGLQG